MAYLSMTLSKITLFSTAIGLLFTPHSALAFGNVSKHPVQSFVSSHTFVVAHNGQEAEQFVDKLAKDAIGFLGNGDLSDAEKQKRFAKLLNKGFDMDTISRFALGRYWKTASKQQRSEYQKLFRSMVIDVYSRRFSEYNGQRLEVRSSRKDSDKDYTVQSYIVSDSGSDVQVDWRVRYKNGQYKVIDVLVAGVSMALTQRSDFASVIQRGGGEISVLIDHLQQ